MIKKLKDLQVNYSLIAFSAFTIKMLVLDAGYADAIIMAVLAGLYGYTQYLKRFQPFKLDEAVQKDLIEVKTALSKLSLARSTDKLKNQKYF